ncbi:MAG: MarR family transcriptional regulator [Firmicutes bacterium]|nr:MarR family transcriptional regulator [Bacillota bacterium]
MTAKNYDQLKLENQLCFPLYACARQVIGSYTPYLKKLGITYTQYIVFMVLWEQDGIPVGTLGAKLHLDNGTLTPLLKKMETAGFVTRTRSREDERVVIVTLTDKGWAMRDQAADVPMQVGSCISMDPEEAQTLYRLLYKIIDQIDG